MSKRQPDYPYTICAVWNPRLNLFGFRGGMERAREGHISEMEGYLDGEFSPVHYPGILMKTDEANSILEQINKHEGPKHPGFMICELRSLDPLVLAYSFDSPKHAAAFLLYQRTQGVSFRLEHDPANESTVLEQR